MGKTSAATRTFRLFATHVNTRETRDLTPFENVLAYPIHWDNRHKNEVLIALNKEDPRAHDAYRLNIVTGELALAAKNPGNVNGWASDGNLNIKAAWASDESGGASLLVRDDAAESGWRPIGTWDADDALTSRLDGLSYDGGTAYLHDSREANAGRFVKVSIANGVAGDRQVIAEDAHYDAGQVIFHLDSYEPQLVAFTRARQEWVVLDETIRADVDAIQKIHPGDFSLINRDHADQIWLIEFSTDDGPVAYYAYDRRTQHATFLFHSHPALTQHSLAHIEPISFAARDGLTLHGYITYPFGVTGAARQNLPLVLDVHGGPWGRNGWGFDSQTQWFANRGYACLQVNFRGSTGYGKAFCQR
ncbi:MAG: prolyl oligopeptidase family serine peptidase, partial [Anaerolineae bacterium]|nr:prolyl oligopeptidase family serine peptidase [Anaerolineae bacterium]